MRNPLWSGVVDPDGRSGPSELTGWPGGLGRYGGDGRCEVEQADLGGDLHRPARAPRRDDDVEDLPDAVRMAQKGSFPTPLPVRSPGARSSRRPGRWRRTCAVRLGGRRRCSGAGRCGAPAAAAFVNGCHVHGLELRRERALGPAMSAWVALAPGLAAAEMPRSAGERGALVLAGGARRRGRGPSRRRRPPTVGPLIHGRAGRRMGCSGRVIGYLAAAAGTASVFGLGGGGDALRARARADAVRRGPKQVMIEGDASGEGLYGGFACLGGFPRPLLAKAGIEADCGRWGPRPGSFGSYFEGGTARSKRLRGPSVRHGRRRRPGQALAGERRRSALRRSRPGGPRNLRLGVRDPRRPDRRAPR